MVLTLGAGQAVAGGNEGGLPNVYFGFEDPTRSPPSEGRDLCSQLLAKGLTSQCKGAKPQKNASPNVLSFAPAMAAPVPTNPSDGHGHLGGSLVKGTQLEIYFPQAYPIPEPSQKELKQASHSNEPWHHMLYFSNHQPVSPKGAGFQCAINVDSRSPLPFFPQHIVLTVTEITSFRYKLSEPRHATMAVDTSGLRYLLVCRNSGEWRDGDFVAPSLEDLQRAFPVNSVQIYRRK